MDQVARKQFMIDIETTGVDVGKDSILEIGILEANFDGKFWIPGRPFKKFIHYPGEPQSEFAKEKMRHIYKAANEAKYLDPAIVRHAIRKYFSECESHVGPTRILMGKAASNFDIPMMVNAGFLHAPSIVTDPATGADVRVGDYTHRIDDLSARLFQAEDLLPGVSRKDLTLAAFEAYPEIEMPEGAEHEALFDCYKQLREVNGLNRILADRSPRGIVKPKGKK